MTGLIEKLKAEMLETGESDERHGWNTALTRAISIVREYDAEQPEKRVADRITAGLKDAIEGNGRLTRFDVTDGIPTKQMCRGARGFIMGLDLNCHTWAAMEKHLNASRHDSLPLIHQKAKDDPAGHITKWDVADCIWQLMARYHPDLGDGIATTATGAAETVPQSTPASDWIEWHGGECPVLPDTVVETEHRTGETRSARLARLYWWWHKNWPGDIIRYRVVRKGGGA